MSDTSTTSATAQSIAEQCRQLGLDVPEPVTLPAVRDLLKAGHPTLHERPQRLLGHAAVLLETVLWVGPAAETGREGLAEVLEMLHRAQALGPDGPGYIVRTDGTTVCALCGRTVADADTEARRLTWIDRHSDICSPYHRL
ncbi:hypothetical protein [Kitasatospora indigofera]|uniref:hypothetical protein n=1 Tax=Kitasatospora indigofera TaxID=67307 RepID=UPI0036AE2D2D